MRILRPPVSTKALDRNLLSRESFDVQTGHLHPIIGMPWDVPVPRKVSLVFLSSTLYIILSLSPVGLPLQPAKGMLEAFRRFYYVVVLPELGVKIEGGLVE